MSETRRRWTDAPTVNHHMRVPRYNRSDVEPLWSIRSWICPLFDREAAVFDQRHDLLMFQNRTQGAHSAPRIQSIPASGQIKDEVLVGLVDEHNNIIGVLAPGVFLFYAEIGLFCCHSYSPCSTAQPRLKDESSYIIQACIVHGCPCFPQRDAPCFHRMSTLRKIRATPCNILVL